jgi:hypothetical protein
MLNDLPVGKIRTGAHGAALEKPIHRPENRCSCAGALFSIRRTAAREERAVAFLRNPALPLVVQGMSQAARRWLSKRRQEEGCRAAPRASKLK